MKQIFFAILLIMASCNSRIEVTERFDSGKPKKSVEYFDNDSTCKKSYYEDGKVEELKCFKDGKQTGEQLYFHKDGTKMALYTFRNGIRHGQTYGFYASGQIFFEGIVKNGEFEGLSNWYFENGKLSYLGYRHLGKDTGWWYYFNKQSDTIRMTYTKSIHDTCQFYDGKGNKITVDEWELIRTE